MESDEWERPPLEPRKPWTRTTARVLAIGLAVAAGLYVLAVLLGPLFAP